MYAIFLENWHQLFQRFMHNALMVNTSLHLLLSCWNWYYCMCHVCKCLDNSYTIVRLMTLQIVKFQLVFHFPSIHCVKGFEFVLWSMMRA